MLINPPLEAAHDDDAACLANAFDEVCNPTRWPVALLRHQTPSGRAWLTVIVKRTCNWGPGRCVDAERQLDVFEGDIPWPDGVSSSLRFETDRVPYKPMADLVLTGHAISPSGRPVDALDVQLAVDAQQHVLRVFGDRHWRGSVSGAPTIGAAEPFIQMPLVYERAFGGIDGGEYCADNPIGAGLVAALSCDRIDGRRLPNIEQPADPIRDWRARPRPAGFAFYGRSWQPRLALAGVFDARYRAAGASPIPPDFSYRRFNGAHPALQRPAPFRGDEAISLTHLLPEGHVSFRLDGRTPQVRVRRRRAVADQEMPGLQVFDDDAVPMLLDTLVLVPEHRALYTVFRGQIALAALDSLEVARISIDA